MPNAHLYDSDWDYYDDCMSPEDRIAQAIVDGESERLVERYIDWMLETRRGDVERLLIDTAEAAPFIDEFAKAVIAWQEEP